MIDPLQMNGISFDPEFLDPGSSWTEHIPFASVLIRMLRPERLVELGVYGGASYLAFCQTIQEAEIACACFGVDTWKGDSQTGFYQTELFDEISRRNEKFHGFSTLLRMTFSEAVERFEDGTIDLLHIDGLHTYEAVAQDFQEWRPKMSRRGVVLFHDTNILKDDFGVWKLWAEVKDLGPSFEFPYGCGLGVLVLGDQAPKTAIDFLAELQSDPRLASYFESLGVSLARKASIQGLQARVGELGSDVAKTLSVIQNLTKENDLKTIHLQKLDSQIHELNNTIRKNDHYKDLLPKSVFIINEYKSKYQHYKDAYDGLMSSKIIILVVKSFSFRDRLLPHGSNRRLLVKFIYNFFTNPKRFFKKLRPTTISSLLGMLRKGEWSLVKERLSYHFGEKKMVFPGYADPLSMVPAGPVEFKQPQSPTVSVLIPVYNQYEHTKATLISLAQQAGEIDMEVLLLDDASTDERISFLPFEIPGVYHIRNEQNLGFLRNVNAGARRAKGTFLYLLNNDVLLQTNTVQSLVETLEKHPEAAAAGSKLVFPDGKLQEAGGIIWSDGCAWNYGRGDDPAKPQYNYLKEADYISGASLMIRREAWEELKGFDPEFSPAYAEDTDLAFSLRALGRKVLYQPRSLVLHFEGVSHGVDEGQGLKAYQQANLKKLAEKWATVLEKEHFPNGQDVFYARDRSASRRHVLFIDHYVPQPDCDAGSRSALQYLRLLADMNFMVHFLPDNRHRDPDYSGLLEQSGIEVLCDTPDASFLWDQWIRDNGQYIDIIILSRPHIAIRYVDDIKLFPNCKKVIYFAHDLQHVSFKRKYELSGNKKDNQLSEKYLEYEKKLTGSVDDTWVFSDFEANYLRENGFTQAVHEIPLFFYDQVPTETPRPFSERTASICFVAGFRHPPNADAALWFTQNIWPRVRQRMPQATFSIVGRQAPDELRGIEGVELLDFLSDDALEYLYRTVRAAVVPLRYGAGVKGKVIEPLCRGLPVVGTSVAAEGVAGLGEVVAVSDDPERMARDIVHILEDGEHWNTLSERGVEFCRERFSKKAARDLLATLLA